MGTLRLASAWLGVSTMLLIGSSPAQVTVEVRTVNPLVATTRSGTRSIPADTVLTSGANVTSNLTASPCNAQASATVTFGSTSAGAQVTFTNLAQTYYVTIVPPCSPGDASVGLSSLKVTLRAPTPTAGTLRVAVNGTGVPLGANLADANYTIDVGNDASPELTGSTLSAPNETVVGSVERAVVIGPSACEVLFGARARAGTFPTHVVARATLDLTLTFRATGRVGTTGQRCGAALTGTLVQDHAGARLTLDAKGSASASLAVLAVGTLDPSLPLPPTGCVLRTDALHALPIRLVNDTWSATLPLATPLPVADLRLQVATGDVAHNVLHWSLSEGVRLLLP